MSLAMSAFLQLLGSICNAFDLEKWHFAIYPLA